MIYFLDTNVIIDLFNGKSKVLAAFKNACFYGTVRIADLVYYEVLRGCILKNGDGCVFTDSSDKTAYDYAGNLIYLAPGKQTICKYEKKEEGTAGGISDEGKLYYSCVTDQDYGVVRIYDKQTKKKIFLDLK